MNSFSSLIIPLIFSALCCVILFSKRDMQSEFALGAEEGCKTAVKLFPTLVMLLTAVSMFGASGAAEAITELLSPFLSRLGIPSELIPLIIVRPISGSGSTALLSDIFESYGPDSFAGKCASVLTASSDTLIYVVSVYMSAAGVKKTRHTLPTAVAVMLLGIFLSCLTVRLLS